jgi:hypothetical protein
VLSKSRLKTGFQCPKALFLALHKPELAAPVSAAAQAQFDEGNEVGDLARGHFGKGVLVDTPHFAIDESLKLTKQFIADGETTIFEAAFSDGAIYCRVDILHRESANEPWQVIEVKKPSKIKPDHIEDLAIQAAVLKRCGVEVESYSIMHMNKECRFPELQDLFLRVDVSSDVLGILGGVEDEIDRCLKIKALGKEPKMEIGPHCEKPYPCPFHDHCWSHIPDFSVFDLPGIGVVKGTELLAKGQFKIEQLDESGFVKNKNIHRAIQVTKSNERFISVKDVSAGMSGWEYPLHFFDFETINPAIPRYEGCGPYLKVPFQFSCHVIDSPGGEPRHFEYLHLETTDPRPPLVKALVEGIGESGSVVAYNISFERTELKKLAGQFPEFEEDLLSIADRLVDPQPILKAHVYDREFRGSFSIKDVAPALLGEDLSYEGFDVGDGQEAVVVAEKVLRGLLSGKELETARDNLLKYCRHDTFVMMKLVLWMQNLGDGRPKLRLINSKA